MKIRLIADKLPRSAGSIRVMGVFPCARDTQWNVHLRMLWLYTTPREDPSRGTGAAISRGGGKFLYHSGNIAILKVKLWTSC